jgi:hypothetical protein
VGVHRRRERPRRDWVLDERVVIGLGQEAGAEAAHLDRVHRQSAQGLSDAEAAALMARFVEGS